MGVLSDEFAVNARKPRLHHPKGWEPGFEWDGRKGTLISDPKQGAESPAFEALMRELGFDPESHEIVGPIQVRRWQQTPGDDYLYYHRATIALRSAGSDADVEQLLRQVAQRKPRKQAAPTGDAGLVVAVADIQIGKSDGDGVAGTMERLDDAIGMVEDRWRDLRKLKVPLSVLYPCFMGDLFESCSGHYAQQAFRTELNIRDQRKVLRAFIDKALDRWSCLAPLGVKVVGGNHGEERDGGKSHTDFADNRDVAVVEDVAFAYSKQDERYGHVSFAIPNDDLTLTFDHDGLVIGLAHGHQAGFGSGDPRTKIHNWWKGQMDGQQPIGDADVLISGHYHHPWMVRRGARTHFGCPALDGGSDWFRNQTGQTAPPGVLSFAVTSSGWSDFQILG